ncbi:MAG: DUF1501 domain-containing protein [Verrucomicrobiales bacterium]|nr:DUF1501 domain-containing protein [Verrucomicrobiales bacterium]
MHRRHFLLHTGPAFGSLALGALLPQWLPSALGNPLAPKTGHHPAKARRVIFLFMNGGPSHHETFDYRPELAKAAASTPRLLAPGVAFRPAGQSGLMISEAFPELARHADDLCILNGMKIDTNGHHQAVVRLHTGNERFVRPSMGSWVVYGLGSEADDLPGFVTISPIADLGGAGNYGSAFLPASYQGTRIAGSGAGSVPHLSNARLSTADQRAQLDHIGRSNQRLAERFPGNPAFDGVIQSYEMAFKMQTSIPETFDLAAEPESVRALYGIGDGVTDGFGSQCLMARRLAERGVRFIQLTSNGWDHHMNVAQGVRDRAAANDKPIAGLLADLKQRDLLKDTLVVWGGEFGRGAHEDNAGGRGHNGSGFTFWMAGGGVKGGYVHGSKDDLGAESVEGILNFADLHATILHLLGLDHERLSYRYAGRNFRLTDTEGVVAQEILA